jgi:tape measure domain-containing protein
MSPSSTTIEREIVQMVFEAKAFRKGIKDSIADLEDFKKSFDLSKAQSSFAELEKASRVDFAPMASALESINNKMSVMGVIAATVVSKITESIMSGAQQLLGTLFFKPLTDGLGEYELQLNAVQTILANTAKAGTTLKDVTAALAELNDYADLTIYNFAQMVTNIGTFTTAGVDLQTSVSAIKGIANVAAISGAGATQAATAMYQLSQAISSGVVRLQDWMSVEKAGMGGVLFQDALIETAKVHGIAVDEMIEKNGSFR